MFLLRSAVLAIFVPLFFMIHRSALLFDWLYELNSGDLFARIAYVLHEMQNNDFFLFLTNVFPRLF